METVNASLASVMMETLLAEMAAVQLVIQKLDLFVKEVLLQRKTYEQKYVGMV